MIWFFLTIKLWDHYSLNELTMKLEELLNDCISGTTTSPVGYLEGIYTLPAFRNKT